MNPVVILIAKKIAQLTKKLTALKARNNKVKVLLEILRLESLVPEMTEITPQARVAIQTDRFRNLSLDQQNIIYGKDLYWVCPKNPDLVLNAHKRFEGDQKICEYFYSQFLVYSSL